MKNEIKFSDRFRYWFDNLFSKGTGALIAGLAVLSLVIIAVTALLLVISGFAPGDGPRVSFMEGVWLSLMRTLDAGTMGGDEGWGFRIIMFILPTLGGVFIISTLIGVLTSGVEGKLEELRKGRSRVIEQGHTAVLGWSDQIYTIITELVAANENQPKSCIVILADQDKVEMEDRIAAQVGDTGKTRLVCRSGNPMDLADLAIASLDTAKSILVLSPDGEDPDSQVIKTVLAITNRPGRREDPYHIVAELRDPKHLEVGKMVGKDEVEWVLVGDFVARVIAQTCRQSGLSVVYTELLDFGGDEIYFFSDPALVGNTYGEALNRFNKNVVLGIKPADGQAALNPPMDTILTSGDQLVVIAEDDDKILLDGKDAVQHELVVADAVDELTPERTLLLGWNWRGTSIINELDHYVAPGSEVVVLSNVEDVQAQIERVCTNLERQKITVLRGETTDRRTLDNLQVGSFDHIILLCYSDTLDVQQADAQTLITLLHLRDMSEKNGFSYSIVSEMLDVRNRNLADVTRADDFIVSDKLVSLMMAQVSENKYLNAVFGDLFDPEGSEVYLKPAGEYVALGLPVNFYTVVEGARRRGETAIGYRIKALSKDASQAYGVTLNPAKHAAITFTAHDKVIVLSEE